MLTALFTIHLRYGFFSVKLVEVTANGTKFGPVGYEIILLYLSGLVALAFGGAGPFSIDQWRVEREFPRKPRLHTHVILSWRPGRTHLFDTKRI